MNIYLHPSGVKKELKNDYIGEVWTPGANTVAYYKFDGNLNDSSGNSRNLSVGGGTVSYGTESGGGKYIYFNSGAYTNNISMPYKSDGYTINLWGKYVSGNQYLLDFQPSTSASQWNRFQYLSSTSLYIGRGGGITVPDMSSWYNMVIINSNNKSNLYMNGEYKGYADLGTWDTTAQYFRLNSVGYTASSYSNYAGPNYMSNLIIENTARTAEQVALYYNTTKSNYGL